MITDHSPRGAMPVTTEQVDAVAGRVRVSGHLARQGVDLLRGTVECLGRQGHARVVVDMAAVASADDGTVDDVRALGRPTADGRLTVVMVNGSTGVGPAGRDGG